MKTILIYDELDGELKFRVVDGDYSHLDRQYINDANTDEKTTAELTGLMFYPEGHEKAWYLLDDFTTKFPVEIIEQNPGECKVVVVGSIP